MTGRRLALAAVPLVALACAASHRPQNAVVAKPPATRPTEPEYRRVSTLLDFESQADVLFAATDATHPTLDTNHARSGASSLLIPKGTRRLTVKLGSLTSGREFPGTWTLAGLYLYATTPTTVSVGFGPCGRIVDVAADAWTPVMADLATLPAPAPPDLLLTLDFPAPTAADLWCDDVILADNARTLVAASEGLNGQGWSIHRVGFSYRVERPLNFRLTLPTADLPGGWTCDESNRIRARFHTSDAKPRLLTLYFDGRSYWDGIYKDIHAVNGGSEFVGRPAAVHVPEEQGRLDRNSPGDANHDGYNESDGSYHLVAAGRHMRITLSPHADAVDRPVLDVRDLPPGDVRATVEGTLAPDVLRLPDGRVLVSVPTVIQRPTTLDVRVR